MTPSAEAIRKWTSKGYTYMRRGECPACSKAVEFWRTPGNLEIPLDPSTLESHFSQCSKAREYRTEQRLKEGVL